MAQRNGRCGSQLRSGWNLLFVHVADQEKRVHPPLLAHVLPTGFMKVRYYGFMNPNCKVTLGHIRNMIETTTGSKRFTQSCSQTPRHITCPSCGGPLKLRLDSAIENFGVVRIGVTESIKVYSLRLSLCAAAQRDGGSLRAANTGATTNSLPNYYATPYLTL